MLNLKTKKIIAAMMMVGAIAFPCLNASAASTMISCGSSIYVVGITNITKCGGIMPNPTAYSGYLSGQYSQAITGYVSVGVGSGNYTSIWSKKILNLTYPKRTGSGATYKSSINVKIQYGNTVNTATATC